MVVIKYLQHYFSSNYSDFEKAQSTICTDSRTRRLEDRIVGQKNHQKRFLESHDADFDVCRAFLIVSMIITHVFEQFYIPDYNRNLTAFTTIGFIFLSGLTRSVIYGDRVLNEPRKYLAGFMRPAFKLAVLFVVSNICIMLIMDQRFSSVDRLTLKELLLQMILGTQQHIFSFPILLPIATTICLSWFVLSQKKSRWDVPIAVLLLLAFAMLELFNVCISVGLHFTFIGLIGTFLGKWMSQLSWNKVMDKVLAMGGVSITAGVFMLVYYITIILFSNKKSSLLFSIHVIPTIAMIFFVYLMSLKLSLSKLRSMMVVVEILSKYMLFAYLFHIFLINVLFLVIPEDGLDFLFTLVLSFLVLAFTVTCCYLINYSNKKWNSSRRIYNAVFK